MGTKVSNAYTDDDFIVYFTDLFEQVRRILQDMDEAAERIIESQDTVSGYHALSSGAKDVCRILNRAHLDEMFHGYYDSPGSFEKEVKQLSLRVSRLRRRREKEARNAERAN